MAETSTSTIPSTSRLFTPLELRSLKIRNRVGVSPMCTYTSVDGFANDWHLAHLGSFANGGAGLIFVEATAVEPEGRISPYDVGLWDPAHVAPLKRITSYLKSKGATAGIQLAHAGRKASTSRPWEEGGRHLREEEGGWPTKAPSAVPFNGQELSKVPHELTVEEILQIQEKFVTSARLALEAGFEVIEIHAAHGYLIHQFYSPHSNRRTDHYGGSFENRIRFLLETTRKVRAVIPDSLPLFVRLSTTDWSKEGWTVDESVELSRLLRDAGVDVIDSSSGFNIPNYQDIPFAPGFQVPMAERIRKEAGLKTAAVGMITTAQQAEEIIAGEKADLVLVARQHLKDPFFAYHAAKELGVNFAEGSTLPIQYSTWFKSRH